MKGLNHVLCSLPIYFRVKNCVLAKKYQISSNANREYKTVFQEINDLSFYHTFTFSEKWPLVSKIDDKFHKTIL